MKLTSAERIGRSLDARRLWYAPRRVTVTEGKLPEELVSVRFDGRHPDGGVRFTPSKATAEWAHTPSDARQPLGLKGADLESTDCPLTMRELKI